MLAARGFSAELSKRQPKNTTGCISDCHNVRSVTAASIHTLISYWRGASGGERAQSQSFLLKFCQALDLEEPKEGDYKFEFDVCGDKGRNFIDLYKRGSFVLESKQSRARRDRSELTQLDLLPKDDAPTPRGKSSRAWDVLMNNARSQAENYARHLPPDHYWPPFIIVCDVGHCFELYADSPARAATTPSSRTIRTSASSSTIWRSRRCRPCSARSGTTRMRSIPPATAKCGARAGTNSNSKPPSGSSLRIIR